MHIEQIRIHNLRSFLDSGIATFSPGINVVVGPNDAGKPTFLKALTGRFDGPHRSLASEQARRSDRVHEPHVEMSIRISPEDLNRFISKQDKFFLTGHQSMPHQGNIAASGEVALEQLLKAKEVVLRYSLRTGLHPFVPQTPFNVYTSTAPGSGSMYRFVRDPSDQVRCVGLEGKEKWSEDLGLKLLPSLFRRIHYFAAQRFNIGEHDYSAQSELTDDARNLPAVLATLMTTNPNRFRRYKELVQRVFPSITEVVSRPKGAQRLAFGNIPLKLREMT